MLSLKVEDWLLPESGYITCIGIMTLVVMAYKFQHYFDMKGSPCTLVW